jgi:hypothetical protein
MTFLERAGEWFLHSGIQESNGGIARFYRAAEGKNAALSTEITAYGISALLELHKRLRDDRYLAAARQAGDYLIREGWREDLATFPFETGAGVPQFTYFFDLGIIARALLRLSRATGEEVYAAYARRAAEAMARDFVCETGGSHPILALPAKAPAPHELWWSRRPGCFHLKAALAWYELGMMDLYERQLEFSLRCWREVIELETERDRIMDRLHALSYFLEGLMPVADRPECRSALQEGAQWGSLLLEEIAPRFERSDVHAQLLRVRLFLGSATPDEFAAVQSFQDASSDIRLRGGYCFGRKGGVAMPFGNPVSTAFCLQAAAWYESKSEPDWRELI